MITNNLGNKIAVMINREGMGEGSPELSIILVKNYLTLLKSENRVPAYICLYADGVKLACEGSPVCMELKALEESGCKVIICKTCLIFYNLLEKLVCGTVGTMLDIIDVQHNTTKIINL
ncbi:MAG: DsrE family protein [Bacteroidales bacterium]|jgi:intracellular sulfur oxidation DsrE/DsrF family protein|nr:DsrE family protein [Bacteroidales bacterium]